MDIQKAIEYAIAGKAILFTGAGFSRGAINIEGENLKTGPELAQYFCVNGGFEITDDLDEASELYLDKFGDDCLIDDLKNKYTVKDIKDAHVIISGLKWKRIYTTNYDNIHEFAYSKLGKKLTPITLNDDIYDIDLKKKICVHLNGFIDRLNRSTLNNEFKLTNSSYLTDSFLSSKWLSLFHSDLRTSKAIFFVGYSLYDLDIKRIIYQLKEIQDKCFFITKPNPSARLELRLKKFGNIYSEGADVFAELVKKIKSSYYVPETEEVSLTSFEHIINPTDLSKPIRDDDIFDLFLFGNKNENFIWQSIQNDDFPPYYISRPQIMKIIEGINSGVNNFLICSDLGNGKTLFLNGLQCKAIENNFNTFLLKDRNDYIFEEVDIILQGKGKILILIENYHNEIDLIEYINLNRSNNVVLVLTCRSILNDVFYDRLDQALNHKNIMEFDLNHLIDEDVNKLINLFNHYGLWGIQASFSKKQKEYYIHSKCRREFQAILLGVIKSPDIQERIKTIFLELDKFKDYRKVITMAFVLQLMGITPRIDIVMDLLKSNLINFSNFRNNFIVKQFINFEKDEILAKSSILAKYALNNLYNGNELTDTLIEVTKNAESLMRGKDIFNDIFRNLLIYSTVQRILPEKNRRANIIRFYESLKDLYHTSRNPFFWLEYAIARLFFKEYDKAAVYFDTAYSYARKLRYFNAFQIDNHYARYLLEKAIVDNDETKCMEAFRSAHNIISNQIKDEIKHYPYRVANNYWPFYSLFYKRVSSAEQKYIHSGVRFVIDSIEKLPEHRRLNKFVVECESNLRKIIE